MVVVPETRPSRPYRRLGSQRWRVRALMVLAIVAILVVAAVLIYVFTQKTITLDVSGDVRRVRTHADTVRGVLDDEGILLDPEDMINPAPSTRLSGGETITVRKALVVAVEADGVTRQVRTQAVHPLDVLAEQSIAVGKYDVIQVDGQDFSLERLEARRWNTPARYIRVIRSATVEVLDRDRSLLVHTAQVDLGRALDTVGLTLYLADRVTPGLNTPVQDGLAVVIERSMPVTVMADGRLFSTRTLGPTVGDALAETGIAPVGLDYTIPPEDTPLVPDTLIRVVRVTENMIVEHEPVLFTVIRQPDPTLAAGEEKLVQEGVNGLRERQIRVRYEDGQATSRAVQNDRIIQPPVPRIIAFGLDTERDGP